MPGVKKYQFLFGITDNKVVVIKGGPEALGTVSFNHDAYDKLAVLTIFHGGTWALDDITIEHTIQRKLLEEG